MGKPRQSRFPLHFPDDEHKALRIAAAENDMTMTDFARVAIREKIARLKAAEADLTATGTHPKSDSTEAS